MRTAPFILSIDINQPPAPTFIEPPTPTNLAALVSTTQAHTYVPGTIRTLHSLWKSFLNFCTAYHVTPLPATPRTIASNACFLVSKTSSYQYILNHLNTVRLLHRFNGFAVDALDSFDVTLTNASPETSYHSRNTSPDASSSRDIGEKYFSKCAIIARYRRKTILEKTQ